MTTTRCECYSHDEHDLRVMTGQVGCSGRRTMSREWRDIEARNAAIRAARPTVRATEDIACHGGTIPAGTIGREHWRGHASGEAGSLATVWVDVVFAGRRGIVGVRSEQVEQVAR